MSRIQEALAPVAALIGDWSDERVEQLARVIESVGDLRLAAGDESLRSRFGLPDPVVAALAEGVAPADLAWALRGAAAAEAHRRRTQTQELVWTGPKGIGSGLFRTEETLLDLILRAQFDLLIVTFAAYRIDRIRRAIAGTVQRGVRVTIVVESTLEEGRPDSGPASALVPEAIPGAFIYYWPIDDRPRDDQGRHGSLHVKCAVADWRTALVSSANLTGFALALNMELGVLLHGGEVPRRIRDHFDHLIREGTLRGLGPTE